MGSRNFMRTWLRIQKLILLICINVTIVTVLLTEEVWPGMFELLIRSYSTSNGMLMSPKSMKLLPSLQTSRKKVTTLLLQSAGVTPRRNVTVWEQWSVVNPYKHNWRNFRIILQVLFIRLQILKSWSKCWIWCWKPSSNAENLEPRLTNVLYAMTKNLRTTSLSCSIRTNRNFRDTFFVQTVSWLG